MTFAEAYNTLYPAVVKFCFVQNGQKYHEAEDAASMAFLVLHNRWNEVASHDSRLIKSFLIGTARNAMRQLYREKPPDHESLDDAWCQDAVEAENLGQMDEQRYNFEYREYIKEIEATLDPEGRRIFHSIVVDELSFRQIAKAMHVSENSLRLRWIRIRKKLKPKLDKLLRN